MCMEVSIDDWTFKLKMLHKKLLKATFLLQMAYFTFEFRAEVKFGVIV